MISQLLEELKKLIPKKAMMKDPADWDDPVALKTEWGPLKGGGTNVRTHVMKIQDDGRHVFRPAFGYILFCGIFLVLGLGLLVLIAINDPKQWVAMLIGAVFALVGGGMLWFGGRPVAFDRSSGLVWRGWGDPRSDFEHGREVSGTLCRLEEIHALQIIAEVCRGKNSRYKSYELNLVKVDGSRLNVVDHGDIARLRQDAAALGVYLEAPIWDTTLPGGEGP
jgi:hypothetical protein